MPHRALSALFIAPALLLAGCGDDSSTNGNDDAPPLPPAASMQFDFEDFDSARLAGECEHLHWTNAAARVLLIDLQVAQWVGTPSLVFAAALQAEPVLQPDESYLWSYSWDDAATEASPDFTARLRGRLEGVHVDWELRVSASAAEPPIDDDVWFYGQSSIQTSSGFWIFIDLANDNHPEVARVTWDFEGTDRALTFESMYELDDNFGDSLSFTASGAARAVVFHDASDNAFWDISWDRTTRAGSLTVPDYNAGEEACWDGGLCDVICTGPVSS